MYKYDAIDQTLVDQRVAQFRDQVARRINGTLAEEEFRPLRLQNGLYHQRHAYMLRVAIPYGLLSAKQLRTLALIAEDSSNTKREPCTKRSTVRRFLSYSAACSGRKNMPRYSLHGVNSFEWLREPY